MKAFKDLFRIGLIIVLVPSLIVSFMLVVSLIMMFNKGTVVEKEKQIIVYDTVEVKKVIKIYDTIRPKPLKHTESVKIFEPIKQSEVVGDTLK